MIHMPKDAKVLKDILSHKEKLEKVAFSVKLNEEYSAVIQRRLPQKEGDLGSFTLPCLFKPLAVKNALADLGASINLMPHSLSLRLGFSKLKPTRMSIQLANRSVKYPRGVDMVDHDGKWIEAEEERDPKEVRAVSFYPKPEPIEPLEWKSLENRLKQSVVKPPKLELKELPKHLEYAFLQGDDQLPVVISSTLSAPEKIKLLKVLRSQKGAIAWSIADIKGIDLSFYTHKILIEDDFKPTVQPQRRVNLNIQEVSPVQIIPTKGGMTIVKNEKNKLIPQRTVTGWRILITLEDQEKTTFTCLYGSFAYKLMSFRLCNALATFQRCMMAIFHELIEDNMDVFMDDFSVFGSYFDYCLKNLEKMLKRYWSLPFEIMCDASDYAIGAVLGQRKDNHFQPIHYASKTMNEAHENYTTTKKKLLAVVLRLTNSEFNIEIHDKKGAENFTTDHLSRLENPDLGKLIKADF
ncbi:DNA-directed DNA polymerase [Tanacetum coccineum]